MPARSDTFGEWWEGSEELCPDHLTHYSADGEACDIWQCQRPVSHVGRHHCWAVEASSEGGFDSEEVEMWWPNPDDPERHLSARPPVTAV